MEDFEYKAPMYVNFVESSALNENDGADTFFDCEETRAIQAMCGTVNCESAEDLAASGTVCASVQSEHQETVDVTNTSADEQSELHNETEVEPKERTAENAYDIINLAMKNLWTASKQKNPEALVEKSGQSLHHEEDCDQKMRATLTTKSGKPKFISMAEAIRQFQTSTPDRFHSKPKTAKFISRLQHRKDIPQVPHVAVHLQSDPVHYTDSSMEGKPAEGVTMLHPKVDARVERKPPTERESLKMTGKVKQANLDTTTEDVPKKKVFPATEPVVPSSSKKSRVYAISLGVKDGVKCVTEKEVHHFGIPTARTVEQKRRTKVQPFSFEERDRQRLKKKEETIQKYLEQEKKTREFRANPVPASVKAFNNQKQGSGLQKMLTKSKELQQGAHFSAVSTTGIQRETLKFKNADRPFTDKNSAL